MEEFLKTIYSTPPEADVLAKAEELFGSVGWTDQSRLVGVIDADIESLCKGDTPVNVKVLMRAAARSANAKTNIDLSTSHDAGRTVPFVASRSPFPQSQVQNIVGEDRTARTLNNLREFDSEAIDVANRLQAAGLSKLPYHLCAEALVWSILESEKKSAVKEGRVAFAYVDLTAKEITPLWLPQDAIGGKSSFGSEGSVLGGSTSSLAELGKALHSATTYRKMFTSYSQWLGAFLKYAPAAIASGQLTATRSFTYINVMARLFEEEEKDENGCCVVALLYDEAFRRSVADRATAKDPELDMDASFANVDKVLLGSCRSRFATKVRSYTEERLAKAQNAERVYNQAKWRLEEHWDDPDFSRQPGKKKVWLLGKIAEKRKKQTARLMESSARDHAAQDDSDECSSDERPPLRRRR
jgi:hypothetical protein